MNKPIIAAALAVATLTAASILPALALSRIPCTANYCGEQKNSPESCGEQLGHLKRVYPAEVEGVDDEYRVWITEFCPGEDLMRSEGNAAYLRTTIADNDVLVEMLQRKGHVPDDVYAVKMMGDDTISLYVHRFGD